MVSIEYELDNEALVVCVPASGIHFPEQYPINNISVLDYFGAGAADEKGSLFVPSHTLSYKAS